jgi:hypothetical protein
VLAKEGAQITTGNQASRISIVPWERRYRNVNVDRSLLASQAFAVTNDRQLANGKPVTRELPA